MKYITHSLAETESLASRLASKLKGGEVIAFTGSLGAGKTAFTRGLMKELGNEDEVSSPTFALVNEYSGKFKVYHFDMYRVESWEDLYSTGFFDYIGTDAVLVIEWSENIETALPNDVIKIDIKHGDGETIRAITITGIDL